MSKTQISCEVLIKWLEKFVQLRINYSYYCLLKVRGDTLSMVTADLSIVQWQVAES